MTLMKWATEQMKALMAEAGIWIGGLTWSSHYPDEIWADYWEMGLYAKKLDDFGVKS